jgi:hypothetical protein
MPHLPFGRLGAVLDLGEKLRFHPYRWAIRLV